MTYRKQLLVLFLLFLVGCTPDVASLGYKASFPATYSTERVKGLFESLEGEVAVGQLNAADSVFATISVFVGPDVVHGGLWQDENSQADHEIDVLRRSLAEGYGNGFRLVEDTTTSVDGVAARSVSFEVNLWPHHLPAGKRPVRVRQWIVYAKKGTRVFRISFLADAAEFAAHELDFKSFLASFRFD